MRILVLWAVLAAGLFGASAAFAQRGGSPPVRVYKADTVDTKPVQKPQTLIDLRTTFDLYESSGSLAFGHADFIEHATFTRPYVGPNGQLIRFDSTQAYPLSTFGGGFGVGINQPLVQVGKAAAGGVHLGGEFLSQFGIGGNAQTSFRSYGFNFPVMAYLRVGTDAQQNNTSGVGVGIGAGVVPTFSYTFTTFSPGRTLLAVVPAAQADVSFDAGFAGLYRIKTLVYLGSHTFKNFNKVDVSGPTGTNGMLDYKYRPSFQLSICRVVNY